MDDRMTDERLAMIKERVRAHLSGGIPELWVTPCSLSDRAHDAIVCAWAADLASVERVLAEEIAALRTQLAARGKVRQCAASAATDPPQDCDMPFCGCDPAWQDALSAASESGWLTDREAVALRASHTTALTLARAEAVAAIRAFRRRVNARAEADMLAGNPITGAHHRALEAEYAALTAAGRGTDPTP